VRLLLALLVTGLAAGSMNALVAASFAVIYNTTQTFHIAHGATFLLAGYASYELMDRGLPVYATAMIVVVLAAAFGALVDLAAYRYLRGVDAAGTTLLLASLGLLIIVEGAAGLVWGTSTRAYAEPRVTNVVDAISLSNADIGLLTCAGWVALLALFLSRSRIGRMLRAVGDSPDMAAALGVPVKRMLTISFLLGSAFVVPAAMTYVWQQGITPSVGVNAILTGVAAVIIVNSKRVLAAAGVALLLTVIQSLAVAIVPTGWSGSATFILLLVTVVARADTFRKLRLAW
jgi:branched-chain amino acid transport system permease protein